MNDQNLLRGLAISAVALAFGLGALRYPIGDFSRAGAGLFPLMVSCLLLLVGVAMVVRSRMVPRVPMDFNFRNIAIILAALCSFALISVWLNMTVAIAALVFISTLAGATYSWQRNLKVTAVLIVIAFAFQKLLGLNLPLY